MVSKKQLKKTKGKRMRLIDIDPILHENVNEAPVGLLKRAGNAIKATLGTGATKAMAQGAQDTAALSNSLYQDFYRHAGAQGVKQHTWEFVSDYLKQVGFAPNTIAHVEKSLREPQLPLNKKQIGQIMLMAVEKRALNQQKLGKTAHKDMEQPNGQTSPNQQTQGEKNVDDANKAANPN